MLKATLRSFLAHKGRLMLSALAIVLSVAFVAGSLIFSDTVTRTFDRLFASTSADVTVEPKVDLKSSVPTGAVQTVPAALAGRVAKVDGVADNPRGRLRAEHRGGRQPQQVRRPRPPVPRPSPPTGTSPTAAP